MIRFAVLVLVFVLACATESPMAVVEGGLYSTPNEDGTFSVLKILKVDDGGLHIRVYSNKFAAHLVLSAKKDKAEFEFAPR